MRVVVTGPTGHIGRCLVGRLLDRGFRVRAVCFGDVTSLTGLDIERVPGDVRDLDSLRAAFEGQDVLAHLAGVISLRRRDAALMEAVNVEGVAHAARAALEAGVRRMVHVSSVHAFRTIGVDGLLAEDGEPATTDPGAPIYDKTKAWGEARLRAAIDDGLNATILNPVGVVGPFDHVPSLLGRSLLSICRKGPMLAADGGFSWVDVRDVADAIIAAFDRGAAGENHLLSGEYRTSKGMCELTDRVAGRARRARVVPTWLLRGMQPLQPLLRPFHAGIDGLSRDALYTLQTRLEVDSGKAAQVFGFSPRPLEASIRDAVAWWSDNGFLARAPRPAAPASQGPR